MYRKYVLLYYSHNIVQLYMHDEGVYITKISPK